MSVKQITENIYDVLSEYFDLNMLRSTEIEKLKESIELHVQNAYEEGLEECPDCDNCEERMGEPLINEGYL